MRTNEWASLVVTSAAPQPYQPGNMDLPDEDDVSPYHHHQTAINNRTRATWKLLKDE